MTVSMLEKQLAQALEALIPLVPFDGNWEDQKTKGLQLHRARHLLAVYHDIQQQSEQEIHRVSVS